MMMFRQMTLRLPNRYLCGPFEVGMDTAIKLDAIYAKPQQQWSDEECALIASLQRSQLQAQGLVAEVQEEGR